MKHDKTQNRRLRWLVVGLVALVALAPATVAAVPSPPHEVFGVVTDQNGDPVEGLTVTVSDDEGNSYTTTTDADGYYVVKFPESDGESGETLTISVKGKSKTTSFAQGTSERIDFTVQIEEDTTPPSDGGPAPPDGGGPSPPEDDEPTPPEDGGPSPPDDEPPQPDDNETEPPTDNVTETTVKSDGNNTIVTVSQAQANQTVSIELDDSTVAPDSATVKLEQLEVIFDSDGALNVSLTRSQGPAPALSPENTTLGYVTVEKQTNADNVGSVKFTYTIERSTLEQRGLAPEDVAIYRYNGSQWNELNTNVLFESNETVTVVADSPGFSTFAVAPEGMAKAQLGTTIVDVSADSQKVTVGDTVTVTATVQNPAIREQTTQLNLTLNGDVVLTRDVTVPGDDGTVAESFEVTLTETGEQRLGINGVSTTVTVTDKAPTTPTQTQTPSQTPPSTERTAGEDGPGFTVIVGLAALLSTALLLRRHKQ